MARTYKLLIMLFSLTTIGVIILFSPIKPAQTSSVITVSGRIEGDDAVIATKITAHVQSITVREGDPVKRGDLIALLSADQIAAREEQARSAVREAEARLLRAHQQVTVLAEQLEQSQLSVVQARLDAEGRVKQAEAQVAQYEALLAQAEAVYKQNSYDAERFAQLAAQGVESERTARQAQTTAEAQAAAVAAATRQVEAARGLLKTAQSSLTNVAIRSSQGTAIKQQILQAQAEIAALQAEVARARAVQKEASADRAELRITAPFDGIVLTRAAEPGELIPAGRAIVTVVDLNKVYLRAFIPEGEVGKVRVGQQARVFLDARPSQPLAAIITRIDPQATFTPENTYFRSERVKQVFGLRLEIKEGGGFAKPGMPADAEITTASEHE